jgi:DNA-binding NarL/FixJ family response regulator
MRVVVADDSVLFREGLVRLLTEAGFAVTAQAGTAEELHQLIDRDPPDVAIVDIRMPPTQTNEGLIAAQRIRSRHAGTAVLVLSQYVEPHYALQLLAGGTTAMGYLLKDHILELSEFTEAVRRVGSGELLVDQAVVAQLLGRRRVRDPVDQLSDRERDVLTLMAEGRSNQSIGELLFLSPKTVEAHVRAIFAKLDLPPTVTDHRRVLAVLTYLRSDSVGH